MNDAVAPVAATASATDVEDRDALDVVAALAGRDAADDLRAVGPVAQAVVPALAAGEALDDDLGVCVDEDAMSASLPFGERDGRASGVEHGRLARSASTRGCRRRQDLRGPPRRWCRRGG